MSVSPKLPHGNIPITAVKDPVTREVFMKLNENIAKLLTIVTELKDAVEAEGGSNA